MINITRRRLRTGALASVAVAAIAITTALPVSAHVGLTPTKTTVGTTSLLTFAFSHGCDGSGTTQLAIQIPAEIETVRPAMNYGWTIEKITEPVVADAATPVAEGEHAAERVTAVVYTAKEAVPDGFYDAVTLQVRLPEGTAGDTLYFPVVQTCEVGETAWVQIPAEGQDGEELEAPAPSITLTAPEEATS